MKSPLCIVAAAALTVGAMGISTARAQNDPNKPTVGQRVENAADKTGDALKNAADKTGEALGVKKEPSAYQSKHAEQIHDVLAQVAEAALTKDGLDDMVERFVDADRNRLGQSQDSLKADDTINGRIAQIQKDWKAKYNDDFDIKDEDKVYSLSFATIAEGEQGGARTASGSISGDVNRTSGGTSASGNVGGVSGNVNVNTDANKASGDVNNKTGVDAPKANTDGQTAADTNRNDPGRNVATVHIAASHGMPALDVPMIHEAGGWKLDIPDSVDGNKFRSNVQAALTEIGDKKDKWSADADDAYRAVTHRVLMAIYDKQADPA